MFEFHAYDAGRHGEPAPLTAFPQAATPASDIAAMSFLLWSEHCVECAAPECYASCALYHPRSDGRCRRFGYGIFRDRRYPSPRGYGADISFRRWGKLKANGNTTMEPARGLLRRERLLARSIPPMRALGRAAQLAGWPNPWADPTRFLDKRARRLHRRQALQENPGAIIRPDAFLIEVVNPAPEPVTLELEMRVALDLVEPDAAASAPAPFRRAVPLSPGHGRHAIPSPAFATLTDCGLPFKMSLTPVGSTPRLVFLALDFVRWSEGAASTHVSSPAEAPAIKCAVFDLDETLWQGALVEGGATRLLPGAVETLRELDRRGILLAAVSKNDPEPALARLRRFGLAELFVTTRIGWGPKSRALVEIAAQLNLGLDAFAFIDDSAFERAEVAAALPQVTCIDARELASMPDDPRCCGGQSAVASSRRRLYLEAERREAVKLAFTGDERAFLRSCRTRLAVSRYCPSDFERVVELAQRTNQLNASGRKYDRGACAELLAAPWVRPLVLRCADVHGDYGTVGFAAVREVRTAGRAQLRVEEFMLSCRVQGRMLEQAFFRHLSEETKGPDAASLWIAFRPTPRNGALARLLEALNFAPADGGLLLSLPAASLDGDLVDVEAMGDALSEADGQPGRRALA